MSGARDLIRALAEAYNRHDLNAISPLYAPTATTYWPDAPEPIGVEALLAAYAQGFAITPDVRVTIQHLVGDDRLAMAELVLSGTNTGPLVLGDLDRAVLGTDAAVLPATGRAISVPAVIAVEADGGRITTARQYLSSLAFLLQFGLLEPASAQPVSALARTAD